MAMQGETMAMQARGRVVALGETREQDINKYRSSTDTQREYPVLHLEPSPQSSG